jgi:hypothetical protein
MGSRGCFLETVGACLFGAVFLAAGLFVAAAALFAETGSRDAVKSRLDSDVENGRPIVAHVIVALCDNENQGIVPVSKPLGDGKNPQANLYWGAAYGVRTYFRRHPDYRQLEATWEVGSSVLASSAFHARFDRGSSKVDLFVVAEAWDGADMAGAITRFLRFAAGHDTVLVAVVGRGSPVRAGGDSAVVVFVGHNGLMDMPVPTRPLPRPGAAPRSSIVLACASRPYFHDLLRTGGSHPLLLTTGLMAPEAYTLEAALSAFAAGRDPEQVRESAADAYHRYQKCGRNAALRLFSTEH